MNFQRWRIAVLLCAVVIEIGCFHPRLPGPPGPVQLNRVSLTGFVSCGLRCHVIGAMMQFINEETQVKKKTKTNENGEYHITLPAGPYLVRIEAEGFGPATEHFFVHESVFGEQTVGFRMSEDDTPRETGRSLLLPKQGETQGFGLYSYLLFRDHAWKGNPRLKELYLASIEGYLNEISTIEELRRNKPKQDLNIIYLPVTAKLEGQPQTPQWLLGHYDFARAGRLLDLFGKDAQIAGPYIVSTQKPLSSYHRPENPLGLYLWQDLTSVEPTIVSLWVAEFKSQASTKNFWESNNRDNAILSLRNAIAKGANQLAITGMASSMVASALQKLIWHGDKPKNP